jgi:hypothetical protein
VLSNRIEAAISVASQSKGKHMTSTTPAKKPTHQAYIVVDREGGKKSHWIRVGSVWPHKNGQGFDLSIPQGMSLSGRIVCMPNDQEPPVQPE